MERICDRRGDLITLVHWEGGGEGMMTMSLHEAKGERDLKQRVWNILTMEICGRRAPVLLRALLNSVCLSSDPQKGSAPWKCQCFPSSLLYSLLECELVPFGHAQVAS